MLRVSLICVWGSSRSQLFFVTMLALNCSLSFVLPSAMKYIKHSYNTTPRQRKTLKEAVRQLQPKPNKYTKGRKKGENRSRKQVERGSGEYFGLASSNQNRMQATVEVLVGKNPTLPSSTEWAGCLMQDFLHVKKKKKKKKIKIKR